MPPAAIIGGGALLGGIAGAIGSKSSLSETQGINLNPNSVLQNQAGGVTDASLRNLTQLVGQGPGGQDVTAATNSSRNLAQMLQQYAQSGGLPGQSDISTANGLASQLFAGQQTALNQSYNDQTTQANQQAAMMGRSINDPILQAKLRTGFMNQQAQLMSNQGSYATQLAMSLPGQRLGYAGQANDLLGQLGSQAMNNQMSLLGAGSSILGNERAYQISTSQRYGNSESKSGGGLGGALTGAIGGAGAGMSMAGGFGAGGGGLGAMMGGVSSQGAMAGFGTSRLAQGMDNVSGFGPTAPGSASGFGSSGYWNRSLGR